MPEDLGSFLPLSPANLYILFSLAAEDRHGYGIMQEVTRQSGGQYKLGPGTLYGAITRLEERGWIRPVAAEDRRQPYTITALGRRHLEDQVSSMNAVVKAAQRRLRHA